MAVDARIIGKSRVLDKGSTIVWRGEVESIQSGELVSVESLDQALELIRQVAGAVQMPAAPLQAIQPLNVIIFCLVPALVAALLLALLARFTSRPQPIFLAIAGVVLLVSFIPDWTAPIDSLAARVLLSVMHLIAAALIVGALWRAASRRPA